MPYSRLQKDAFDRLVDLATPHLHDAATRRALLEQALFGCPVLETIDWSGPPRTFTINLLRTLMTFGECQPDEPAWIAFARELRRNVGWDKQHAIDALIDQTSCQATHGEKTMLPPELQATAIVFLIQTGEWARSKLSERWKLWRKEREAAIDLDQKADVEAQAPAILEQALQSRSASDAERTLSLIKSKQDLIAKWKRAVVNAEQERTRGEITDDVLQNRKEYYAGKIRETLEEIRADFGSLGLTIEKG